jgi:hypothetical protein
MKPKKTYKSLTELSADSIGAVNAETEKTKPPQPHVAKDGPPQIPRESLSRVSEGRGYHRWGINE